MHTRLLSLLAIALTTSALPAADWNRFRGPEGMGTSSDKDVPVTFAPKDALWKTPIPGIGHSSPIISKGKVFLQTASDDKLRRSLVCIDAATGKIDWSKDVAASTKIDWKGDLSKTSANTHALSSHASCTPTADGERVYVVFWDGVSVSLTAWDFSGKELWSQDLGTYKSQHGPGMSPIVVGDRVILNLDQDELAEVVAFEAKTGNPLWKKSRQAYRASYPTPFVLKQDGKTEVVVASTAGITAYDPKDGAVIWNWTWVWKTDPTAKKRQDGPDALRNVGGPIYHNGLIYAISGDGGGAREMVAIKPGTSGDVTDSARVWVRKKETPYVPMPLANGDYIFWVTDKENLAICAEAKTGEIVYKERLGGTAQVTASPILVDGKIYTASLAGKVFVFDAQPKFNLLAENDLKEAIYASPAVADGKLFIRGTNHLFCFGKK